MKIVDRLIFTCILCCFSFQSQAFVTLTDGTGFQYHIDNDGSLQAGTANVYSQAYRLSVNGIAYSGSAISAVSNDGREVSTSRVAINANLTAERKIYVAPHQNFVRYSEILRNTSNSPLTNVSVTINSTLDANSAPRVVSEPVLKSFLITADNNIAQPYLLHYHSQANGATGVSATHQLSANQLAWTYSNLTIPANQQVRIVYFVAQTHTLADAEKVANAIATAATLFFENINISEYSQLLNFSPASVASTLVFDSNTPALVVNGAPLTSSLSNSDLRSHRRAATPAKGYKLSLNAGENITLQLTAGFDAYLYVFSDAAASTLIASNDNANANTQHAEVVFTAPSSGVYYVEATTYERTQLGTFTLTAQRGTINHSPIVKPILFSPNDNVVPVTVSFNDLSTDTDGQISERCWQFGDGSAVQCTNSALVTHTYTEAGQFTVGLTVRDNNGLSQFIETVVAVKTPATKNTVTLSVGSVLDGELSPRDTLARLRPKAYTDRYLISAPTVGKELIISMKSNAVDSYLYLFNEYHQLIAESDNSDNDKHALLRYTPQTSDDLIIEATSHFDGEQGVYQISSSLVSASTPVTMTLESAASTNNPLQVLHVARLPSSFNAQGFAWDFGDGNVASTSAASATHTYAQAGVYNVVVSAKGNSTVISSHTINVSATQRTPIPNFSVSPLFGDRPLQSFFTNNTVSTDGQTPHYVWRFGDGTVSTTSEPTHLFESDGVFNVVLEATSPSSQQTAAYSYPVAVIERQAKALATTGIARERPQVLLAGLEPMLMDVLDTHLTVFAIVRQGDSAVRTVRVAQNGSSFSLVLQHTETYANGDQRFEAILPISWDVLGNSLTVGNWLGSQAGQFYITAIAQDDENHSFPNLEIGKNAVISAPATVTEIRPNLLANSSTIKRSSPQVLGAGFDPVLVDNYAEMTSTIHPADRAQITVTALVRTGDAPIKQVRLLNNEGTFQALMIPSKTLANGDKLYTTHLFFALSELQTMSLKDLWGAQAGQFRVEAMDYAQQTHRFPELTMGVFRE